MNEANAENYKKYDSARLRELSRYLRRYADGDYAESIPIPEDEGQFAAVFDELNEMIGGVKETIDEQQRTIRQLQEVDNALRESERNLAKAQRIAKLGNWDWDVQGESLAWSDEVYRVFGVDKDFELTFQGIRDMIHPDDLEQNRAFINQLFEKTDSTAIDFRIIRPDGEIVHIHQTSKVQRDDEGNPERIFGIMQDITEQKQAEKALRENERFLQNLLQVAPMGLGIIADRKFQFFNEMLCQITGYHESELQDSNARMLYQSQAEYDRVGREKQKQLAESSFAEVETQFVRKDGEIIDVMLRSQLFDPSDPSKGLVSAALDITERKQTEQALEGSILDLNLAQKIANIGNWTFDPAIGVPEWSSQVYEIYERDPSLGPPHIDEYKIMYQPDQYQIFSDAIQNAIQHGTPYDIELELKLEDKTKLIHAICQPDEEKTPHGHVLRGTIQDITEHKRAEVALEESNQRLFTVLNSIDAHIYAADMETYQILFMNAPMQADFGDDLVGKKCWEEFCGEPSPCAHCSNDKLIDQDGNPTGVYVWEGQNPNTKKWYLNHDRAVKWIDGRLVRLQIATDITERVRAEEALRASETKFREIFNSTSEAIVIHDAETGQMIDCNKIALEMYGYDSKDEMLAGRVQDFSADKDGFGQKEILDHISRAVHDGAHTFEWLAKRKNGEAFWVEVSLKSTKIRGEGKILAVVRDVTDRKRVEEALRSSEEKYRTLIESSNDSIFIIKKGMIQYVNAALLRISGYDQEELIGQAFIEFVAPEERKKIQGYYLKRISGKQAPDKYESKAITQSGEVIPVEVSVIPIQYEGEKAEQVVCRDIRAQKEAEKKLQEYSQRLEDLVEERTEELKTAHEKLLRQERLAALGQLAGSVSHELRNPLGVINNAIYYLKMKVSDGDEDIEESLKLIDEETQNATKIISDLLDFGRIQSAQRAPVEISEMVSAVIQRNPPPEQVTVDVDVPKNLPSVFVDGDQLQQVLANLITNAYQAMSSSSSDGASEGGELSVNSEQWAVDSVQIEVSDTGTGIPPENMDKIFEPLFTTRARGIGLGLAICKKLVEANSGRIEVESEVNEGTKFRVFLPVAKETDKR
jgi:PAS domain S-box-containing protein